MHLIKQRQEQQRNLPYSLKSLDQHFFSPKHISSEGKTFAQFQSFESPGAVDVNDDADDDCDLMIDDDDVHCEDVVMVVD